MSLPLSTEKRILKQAEFELVARTHHPQIGELSRNELRDAARRLRDYRNKARDTARQQRREMRGKADARGARAAADDTGTNLKKTVFSAALKRVNRELGRLEQAGTAETQVDIARRALALKRANRVRHHPAGGRTAHEGMNPVTSDMPTVTVDPREIGRVSQFVKSGQARRDG
ncbi:MAG: hypothetical protein ACK4QW_06405 [Alphaproteobacteria bacterium]